MFQANEVFSFVRNEKYRFYMYRPGLSSIWEYVDLIFFLVLFLFHERQSRMGSQSEIGIIPILLTLALQECEIQAKGLASYFLYSCISPTLNLIKLIHNCGLIWGLKKFTIWVHSHLNVGINPRVEEAQKRIWIVPDRMCWFMSSLFHLTSFDLIWILIHLRYVVAAYNVS